MCFVHLACCCNNRILSFGCVSSLIQRRFNAQAHYHCLYCGNLLFLYSDQNKMKDAFILLLKFSCSQHNPVWHDHMNKMDIHKILSLASPKNLCMAIGRYAVFVNLQHIELTWWGFCWTRENIMYSFCARVVIISCTFYVNNIYYWVLVLDMTFYRLDHLVNRSGLLIIGVWKCHTFFQSA